MEQKARLPVKRSGNKHLRAMADDIVKRDGADGHEEWLTGWTPLDAKRKSEAGKGDERRPRYVSDAEYSRRLWLLFVDCPRCGRNQFRSNGECTRCGAKLPKAKTLSMEC